MSDNAGTTVANASLARWLTYLMFFTFAMTTDAVGSVIPRIIDEFRLSMTAASAFQYATMGGIAVGALGLGFLANLIGRKATIMAGLGLYGLGSLLIATSHAFPAFVALLALSGLGISVFKTGALALIGDISRSTTSHTRVMNTVEGFFAVGAIVGPAIVAVLLTHGISWKWLYLLAAAICVVLVLLAASAHYPAARATTERASLAQIGAVMRDPLALGFAALIALYVAAEVAIYVWMPTYLRDYVGAHTWLPAYALTLFFVLRAVGRFVGAWLLDRVAWTTALVVLGGAIFACFAASLAGGRALGAWLLPLTGLFMSIVYPTLNSKAISCFPKVRHGAAAGVMLFFTAVAAAAGPLAMGAVSDAWGDTQAGFVLATVFAALLFAGLIVNRLADPAGRRLRGADAADYDLPNAEAR